MLNKIRSAFAVVRSRLKSRVFSVGLLATCSAVLILLGGLSVNNVTIDNGGKQLSFKTFYSKAEDILNLANINTTEQDDVTIKADKNNISLAVKYSFPVHINYSAQNYTVNVTGGTVNDALAKAGITLNQYDIINLSTETVLTKTENIDITHIDYVTETATVEIPFSSTTTYSSKLAEGKKQVTDGQVGLKQVTYQRKLVNGVVCESQVVNENIIQKPVNKTVVIGTKKPVVTTSTSVSCVSTLTPAKPIELDKNGNPVSYKKHITVQATAYTASAGKRCSTGVVAAPGYIAVNPKFIPYGTKMYIKSSDGRYIYGYAVAADTGGFAKKRPTNVDLFFPTKQQCIVFGRRNVEIYILE